MTIEKEEELQSKKNLRTAAINQWSQIHAYLANNPGAPDYEDLEEKDHALIKEIYQLQLETIRLLGANTKSDLEKINKAAKSINDFVAKIQKVEKSIAVVVAVIAFIGAATTKDPKAMAAAAKVLYEAIEKYNKEEAGDTDKNKTKDKGDDKSKDASKTKGTKKTEVIASAAVAAKKTIKPK